MNNKGFTMVEVLGVITILVVISLFTFPMLSTLTNDNIINQNKQFLDSLYNAVETYIEIDYNRYKNNEISYISAKKLVEEGLLHTNFTNPNTNKLITEENGIVEVTRNIDNSFSFNYVTNNYITIDYIEDLINILNSSDNYENKTIVLTRNLDFNDDNSYKDINASYNNSTIKEYLNTFGIKSKNEFKGNINGNGYSINNIYIENDSGIFSTINSSTIKNINLQGICESNNSGLLTSNLSNSTIDNVSIDIKIPYSSTNLNKSNGGLANSITNSNLNNINIILDINSSGNSQFGGLAVEILNSQINNCKQSGSIIASKSGGLVLNLKNSHINNSTTKGKMSGELLGGIAYSVDETSEINNSSSISTLDGNSVGGLAYLVQNSTIKNSNYIGNMSSKYVGGLTCLAKTATIEKSYASTNINIFISNSIVGGLISESQNSTINNSYSLFNINTIEDTHIVGGLIGKSNTDTITNVYASGSILNSLGNIGGLIGNSSTSTLTNSYFNSSLYDGNIIGNTLNDTITNSKGLTSEEMILTNSFNNWNFTNIWNINGTSFPTLRKES